MPPRRQKYMRKSPYQKQIEQIVTDIMNDNLDTYTLISLTGHKNFYRIRKGNVRIIFEKTITGNIIKYIGPRGDIYNQTTA